MGLLCNNGGMLRSEFGEPVRQVECYYDTTAVPGDVEVALGLVFATQ